jgi:hypothetical protein
MSQAGKEDCSSDGRDLSPDSPERFVCWMLEKEGGGGGGDDDDDDALLTQ